MIKTKTVICARATSRERLLVSIITSIVVGYQLSPVEAKNCGNVASIPNGDAISSIESSYPPGATIKFTCDAGFEVTGSPEIICKSDGQWSDSPPHCTALKCKKKASKVESDRKCRKSCTTNKDCLGSKKKCLCDGYCGKSCFNPAANCPTPTPPKNGFVDYDRISYGYKITYACKAGFRLFGSAIRTCRSDRKWSGDEPKCIDYSLCGRTDVPGVWPWQALITHHSENILLALKDQMLGGGSLINNRWVLTVAQFIDAHRKGRDWHLSFTVFLGTSRRPTKIRDIERSTRIFQPEKIVLHDQYNYHNGEFKANIFQNDAALIKLGREYRMERDGRLILSRGEASGMVDFSPYIRPVCLPCSSNTCISKMTMANNPKAGNRMTPDEKCRIEQEYLLMSERKGLGLVSATGFGQNSTLRPDGIGRLKELIKEVELKIEERSVCQRATEIISNAVGITEFRFIFTDEMLCTTPKHPGVDTCRGDAGGPLVRQVLDEDSKEACFVQVGIISWGYGCGFRTYIDLERFYFPSFYTNAASMIPWINKTMEDN